MKNIILILVLFLIPVSAVADGFYTDNRFNGGFSNNTYYDKTGESWFNNNYQHPVTYEVDGNHIKGSDGSYYTIQGGTIQNDTTGKTYQINGNILSPLN